MLKTSNENLIFMYLNFKREIGAIDKVLNKLDNFTKERTEKISLLINELESDKAPSQIRMILTMLRSMGINLNENIPFTNDIKSQLRESLNDFHNKTSKELNEQLDVRLNIINDLETAFNVLKEEMPEIVEKYTQLVNLSDRF